MYSLTFHRCLQTTQDDRIKNLHPSLHSSSTGFDQPNWTRWTKKRWHASRAFHDTVLWESARKRTPPRPAAQLIWSLATWPSRLAQHHGKPPRCSLTHLPPPRSPVWGISLLWSGTYCHSLSRDNTHTHTHTHTHTQLGCLITQGAAGHD